MPTRTSWLLLLILSSIWGSSFLFVKLLDDAAIPPFTLAFGRVAIGATGLILVLALIRKPLPAVAQWPRLLLLGTINNAIPFALIAFAETQITSALAAILNATTPLAAFLIAPAFHDDERMTFEKGVGLLIGFTGVAIALGLTFAHGRPNIALGSLCSILAAISYATGGMMGRRILKDGTDPLTTATGQLIGATIFLAIFSIAVDHPWRLHIGLSQTWPWLGLGLLNTSVAYILYFTILKTAKATNLLLTTFIQPIVALLLAALILKEPVTPNQITGIAVIALGIMLVNGRYQRS